MKIKNKEHPPQQQMTSSSFLSDIRTDTPKVLNTDLGFILQNLDQGCSTGNRCQATDAVADIPNICLYGIESGARHAVGRWWNLTVGFWPSERVQPSNDTVKRLVSKKRPKTQALESLKQ